MRRNMLDGMATSAPDQVTRSAAPSWGRQIVVKITLLTLLCLVLGFIQGWAASRFYRPIYIGTRPSHTFRGPFLGQADSGEDHTPDAALPSAGVHPGLGGIAVLPA